MSLFFRRLGRGLSGNHARTSQTDVDPRLQGRTYAVPFEQVWQAALALAGGGLRRWHIVESDDYEGVIKAESKTLMLRYIDDVIITIQLDHDAQTRVDMESRSRKGSLDFGANARRTGKFFRALDQKLKR